MRKLQLASIVLLGLSLTSCAAWQKVENAYVVVTSATVTPNQVYIAANAFDAVEASATQYLRLPVCGSVPCRDPNATKSLVASIRSGRLARNKLESAVGANPGAPVDANLFATLTSSTSTIKAILAEFGVN